MHVHDAMRYVEQSSSSYSHSHLYTKSGTENDIAGELTERESKKKRHNQSCATYLLILALFLTLSHSLSPSPALTLSSLPHPSSLPFHYPPSPPPLSDFSASPTFLLRPHSHCPHASDFIH